VEVPNGIQGKSLQDRRAGFTVHWIEPDRVVLKTDDSRITKPDGSEPGIWVTASSDPDSADYDPNKFNRLAGILLDHGQAQKLLRVPGHKVIRYTSKTDHI